MSDKDAVQPIRTADDIKRLVDRLLLESATVTVEDLGNGWRHLTRGSTSAKFDETARKVLVDELKRRQRKELEEVLDQLDND